MAQFQNSIKKFQKAINYLENEAPVIIGTEAVNHFKESFIKEGFTDKNLEKWEEVERRKPSSPWRGFQYGSTAARPGVKRRKANSTTHYSPAAEKRPILSGPALQLMNSIEWRREGRGVLIIADEPYAKVQNEGGTIRIFGKSSARLPKRQFMGPSAAMRSKIRSIIMNDLKHIFK